jgi:hypothetical protein
VELAWTSCVVLFIGGLAYWKWWWWWGQQLTCSLVGDTQLAEDVLGLGGGAGRGLVLARGLGRLGGDLLRARAGLLLWFAQGGHHVNVRVVGNWRL